MDDNERWRRDLASHLPDPVVVRLESRDPGVRAGFGYAGVPTPICATCGTFLVPTSGQAGRLDHVVAPDACLDVYDLEEVRHLRSQRGARTTLVRNDPKQTLKDLL